MSLLANSNAIETGGYQIQRSLRFRSSASAYLNRTPATQTNQQKFTWSGWAKLGVIGTTKSLLNCWVGNQYFDLRFDASSFFGVVAADSAGTVITSVYTNALYRDPSAWYHVIASIDTTQATANNRVVLYVNGVQASTTYATVPSQNTNYTINTANLHTIGKRSIDGLQLFDGYLAEVNFIDGQALTPSSFGQTDAVTGVWTPKKYAGTYGTNGFYLPFSDNISATTLAYDKSGNGNNWTPNNISTTAGATYDSMTDVPTLTSATAANYCVMNPLVNASTNPMSNGNLQVNSTGTSTISVGTIGVTSGKWYWEGSWNTGSAAQGGFFGISSNLGAVNYSGSGTYLYYSNDGSKWSSGTSSAYGASYVMNDIIGIAFDADAGTLSFYKNGVSQGTAITGLTSGPYFPTWTNSSSGADGAWLNFGQRPFAYTPPTGFKALNTFNLPDPVIKKPNQYMDATLYTGTGATQNIVNAGGFQPNMVWVKDRSRTSETVVSDSVRGTTKQLFTPLTNAEQTDSTMITAFNSNGFRVGDNSGGPYGNVNYYSGDAYVGWQWKQSATAGFDIVTYTGNGTAGRTISHSLGVAPKMIFVKVRSNADNWQVGHDSMGWNGFMYLNLTNGYTATSSAWNNTAPTSSVFTVGSDTRNNFSGYTYIAYLFAEIPGYSKFGSFSGNTSTDGPMVYCGFAPKYVMLKRTDAAGYDWFVFDSTRNTYNVLGNLLKPNLSDAESSATYLDLLSNGFKIRATSSGVNTGTIIYAAFAENPFKYSLAR